MLLIIRISYLLIYNLLVWDILFFYTNKNYARTKIVRVFLYNIEMTLSKSWDFYILKFKKIKIEIDEESRKNSY